MEPHWPAASLDMMQDLCRAAKTPIQADAHFQRLRARTGLVTPNLTNVRKALRGTTYARGVPETRGRKRKLSRRMVLSMNSTGKALAAITPLAFSSHVSVEGFLKTRAQATRKTAKSLQPVLANDFLTTHRAPQYGSTQMLISRDRIDHASAQLTLDVRLIDSQILQRYL